ncbi:tolB protein-related protein [Prunus dulcis]|uniref:tRNA:m(4)X modification enzyme TRM13 n=1 Tax=Prunus dulcis TaxID=3755 RepID=A0A4Y1R3D0_PRUDU|nr:tolB protein-related protein [Prunus dulcis]
MRQNLEGHVRRCPLLKQVQSLTLQPFYQKGINAGKEEDQEELETFRPKGADDLESSNDPASGSLDNILSEMKRNAVYSMTKIEHVHESICKDIQDSYQVPEACGIWIKREVDRKLPFQEKHVMQQVSILGNLEGLGVLKSSLGKERADYDDGTGIPAVVEFGAGRGYLTQMLADCYGIKRCFWLKENRTIEDLNLNAVGSLREDPYLAIGKHLCGPATDLTLRCCLGEHSNQSNAELNSVNPNLRGLAIATCCHHLCQWKHYINADHGADLPDVTDCKLHLESIEKKQCGEDYGVEEIVRNMKAVERAVLGFMCKKIIDMGRLMWMKEHGLDAQFVKYVPSSVSPENHLLIGRCPNHL